MQTKIALGTLVLAAGFTGAAFADVTIAPNDTFVSSKTRAEVNADRVAFKKAGVDPWSRTYNPLKYFRSATTREAVTADYVASRDQTRALTGEDSGSAYLAHLRAPAKVSTNLAGTPANAQ